MDFRDGLEEEADSKGGRGVVGRLPGFVKDYPIRVFEGDGVVPEGNQRGKEVQEEAGVGGVHPFPDRVRYIIRAWCGGGGRLG